ncbi:hypothetical protein ATANTOWER_015327 [Ataeniobius toweri]|uniref:Uncharacterized protein n=1 Tax=Ataeniobius toweri TaxID=208326 RepID=A0ABU7AGR9_9TELE|nr:hypothetical protein [Ataeniobius toweri]
MEAFFNFISPTEKDVLTEALDNFTMADEELLSILSSHNCTLLPTDGNLPKLVEEITHKEMVQESAFIIKCWQQILRSVGESISYDGLNNILDDLKPRARCTTSMVPPVGGGPHRAVFFHRKPIYSAFSKKKETMDCILKVVVQQNFPSVGHYVFYVFFCLGFINYCCYMLTQAE